MATNAKRFKLDVQRFASELTEEGILKAHRALTLIALERIIDRTPVDTGRARGNWQTTTITPAKGVIDKQWKARRKDDDARRGVNGANAKARAMKMGNAAIATLRPFSISHITNNLPYIEALENGHSKRAPQGMLAVTFAELDKAEME